MNLQFIVKDQYKTLDPAISKIKLYPYYACMIGLGVLGFWYFDSMYMIPLPFWCVIGGGFFLGSMMFFSKAIFHQEKKMGTISIHAKNTFKGAGISAAFCLLFVFISSPLISNKNIDPSISFLFFAFAGPLAPELNIDNAKTMLAIGVADDANIYKKTPGINEAPVSEIFHKPSAQDYYHYVKYSNASSENKTYILELISKKKDLDLYDRLAANHIVKSWPKGEEFPKHLLAQIIKKHDLPKEARVPASENIE